jgi:hypothetical protein
MLDIEVGDNRLSCKSYIPYHPNRQHSINTFPLSAVHRPASPSQHHRPIINIILKWKNEKRKITKKIINKHLTVGTSRKLEGAIRLLLMVFSCIGGAHDGQECVRKSAHRNGRDGDGVHKRRRCWPGPVPSILGRIEHQPGAGLGLLDVAHRQVCRGVYGRRQVIHLGGSCTQGSGQGIRERIRSSPSHL